MARGMGSATQMNLRCIVAYVLGSGDISCIGGGMFGSARALRDLSGLGAMEGLAGSGLGRAAGMLGSLAEYDRVNWP